MKPPAAAAAGNRAGGVDPSIPRFKCQECHRALVVGSVDSFAEKLPAQATSGHVSSVHGSIMGASRMDNSYVVLSKQNKSHGHGIPPRSPSAAAPHIEPNQPTRAMEGSYIVLPPAAASIYKTSTSEGGGAQAAQLPPPSINSSSLLPGNSFHSNVTVLKRAFEIATSQTQVEQPMCLGCMRLLSDKMDKEIEDVNADIKAYEVCLQHLEQESYNVLSDAGFQEEKLKIEEEEKKLNAAIEEAEKQYSEISSEMKDLEIKSKELEELEERFGPVDLFWSTRFDKAMTWFLTCLQDFAEFAISLDKENNVPPEKSLKLPYKIDGDKAAIVPPIVLELTGLGDSSFPTAGSFSSSVRLRSVRFASSSSIQVGADRRWLAPCDGRRGCPRSQRAEGVAAPWWNRRRKPRREEINGLWR
uniref:Atg6/beclin coiled-coil domain-containing protein n=1 Tax=Oryza meridionalis TaxID=40149 RepID=A0A0E0CYA2_9ORYZ